MWPSQNINFTSECEDCAARFTSLETVFENFMKWGPKGGILILVENGPPGFYLWCCGDHWHGFLTFIQIAHGHTVKMLKINFLNEAIIFLKMLKIANFNNIIFDFAQENKSVKNILVGIKIFQCNFKLVLAWFCTAFFFYDAPKYSLEVFWLASEV